MKNSKLLMMLGLSFFGFSLSSFSQETLPEVTIKAVRYKYLNAVGETDLAQPVKLLERQAAEYDIKSAEFYEDEYDSYFVSFFIPDGKILASYDKDGKLLRTAEKYKDVVLPKVIQKAVVNRFPGWGITKDIYYVNYYEDKENATKLYKLILENGNKRVKVKVNEKGEFI